MAIKPTINGPVKTGHLTMADTVGEIRPGAALLDFNEGEPPAPQRNDIDLALRGFTTPSEDTVSGQNQPDDGPELRPPSSLVALLATLPI